MRTNVICLKKTLEALTGFASDISEDLELDCGYVFMAKHLLLDPVPLDSNYSIYTRNVVGPKADEGDILLFLNSTMPMELIKPGGFNRFGCAVQIREYVTAYTSYNHTIKCVFSKHCDCNQ